MDDTKSFWKTINSILPNSKKLKQPFSTVIDNGSVLNGKSTIAESFNRFFALIVKNITSPLNCIALARSTQSLYTDKVFEFSRVNTGFDDWKYARVIPIDLNPERKMNYIIIAQSRYFLQSQRLQKKWYITSCISIFTENRLLSIYQSGFRKGFSTKTAVTYFVDSIRKNMDDGLLTGAVYIDLEKVLDTVDHELLLEKIHRCGENLDALSWFESYLCNLQQVVDIEGFISPPMSTETGVCTSG